MAAPGAPMRFRDPTLISDRKNGGAAVGPALKYHEVPEWFEERLRAKFGALLTPHFSVVDWIRKNVRHVTWVDHWGALHLNGQSAFVAEPYQLFPEDMRDIVDLAEAMGCWVLVTATSSWYPTHTLRIEFWDSQKAKADASGKKREKQWPYLVAAPEGKALAHPHKAPAQS